MIVFVYEYILMFRLCDFTSVIWMNNFMYTVLNAEVPVMYIGVGVHMQVKFVVRNLVKRAV